MFEARLRDQPQATRQRDPPFVKQATSTFPDAAIGGCHGSNRRQAESSSGSMGEGTMGEERPAKTKSPKCNT